MNSGSEPAVTDSIRPDAIELTSAWGLRLSTSLRLPRFLDVVFDSSVTGEGWHPWEAADAMPFRWMGSFELATIDIAVDRSVDLVADLGIYMMIDQRFDEQLAVGIDGVDQPLAHQRTIEGLTFTLPAQQGDSGLTRLTIHAGEGVIILPDPRRLSVAFSHLRIRPAAEVLEDASRLVLRARFAQQLRAADERWPLTFQGSPCVVANL